jgi:hypothetical protein
MIVSGGKSDMGGLGRFGGWGRSSVKENGSMTDRRWRTVAALGSAQTLAWASSYYLPAMLAAPMARDLGVTPATVFAAFSLALVVSALLGPLAGRATARRKAERTTEGTANAGRKRYPPAKFTQPSEAWTAPVFIT